MLVTIASIQDRDGGLRLLAQFRERLTTIRLEWADGGYAGRLVEWAKRVLLIRALVARRFICIDKIVDGVGVVAVGHVEPRHASLAG